MGLWRGDVNAINTCKKMWNAIIRKNGNLPLRQTLLPLSTTRGTPKAVVNLKCSFTSLQRFRSLFSDLVSQISGVCFLFFSFPRCSQWPIAKQTWLLSAIKNIILCIYLHLVTFPPFFFFSLHNFVIDKCGESVTGCACIPHAFACLLTVVWLIRELISYCVSVCMGYLCSPQLFLCRLHSLCAPAAACSHPTISAYVNISFMSLIHIMSLVLRGSTSCERTTPLRYSLSRFRLCRLNCDFGFQQKTDLRVCNKLTQVHPSHRRLHFRYEPSESSLLLFWWAVLC